MLDGDFGNVGAICNLHRKCTKQIRWEDWHIRAAENLRDRKSMFTSRKKRYAHVLVWSDIHLELFFHRKMIAEDDLRVKPFSEIPGPRNFPFIGSQWLYFWHGPYQSDKLHLANEGTVHKKFHYEFFVFLKLYALLQISI